MHPAPTHDNAPSPTDTAPKPTVPSADIGSEQRKALPAWIRQGLEKMEREKEHEKDEEERKTRPLTPPTQHNSGRSRFVRVLGECMARMCLQDDSDDATSEPSHTPPPSPDSFDVLAVLCASCIHRWQYVCVQKTALREWMTHLLLSVVDTYVEQSCTTVYHHLGADTANYQPILVPI